MPELTIFLERYREAEKTKRAAKAKAKEDAMDGEDDEDDGGDEHKVNLTPQSMKSKGDETADNSMLEANEGDQTEDEDRDGEGDGNEEDEADDMED